MGAAVQEATKKTYTDASGNFYEGMKRKEAEEKMSLFINYEKLFDKIDKDGDGELSRYEISSELENDIDDYRSSLKWASGLGIINALLGVTASTAKHKKSGLIATGICLFCAIRSKLKINEFKQRLVQGHN